MVRRSPAGMLDPGGRSASTGRYLVRANSVVVMIGRIAMGNPRAATSTKINRNNGQEEVYPYSFQPEIWDEIVEIVTGVESKVRAGVPPEKEVSAWKCKRCPYLHACQPFGEKGKSTWRRV